MNILVTGSNGFIGSHIVHRLVEQGHEVFGLVTPFEATEVYYMKLLQGSKVLSGDLRDRFSLDLAVREANPEIIFHLGALTSVGQSFRNPEVFSDTNYLGTMRLLASCSQHAPRLQKFINTTTTECLKSRPEPHTELNFEYDYNSPYGVSKIAAEFYTKLAYRAQGIPTINVRPNNTFHRKTSKHFLVETIVTQMLEGDKVALQGSTDITRNWTLVDDTVSGFLAVMENGKPGELYHLARKENIASIADLIEVAKRVLNWSGEVVTGTKPRPYDPTCLTLDTVRDREIGWKPKHSLEQAIKIVADFWRTKL